MTQFGELMVEFPLQPGLARALLKAASLGCQDLLLPVAAMLSVENIFIRPGQHLGFKAEKKTRLMKKHTSRKIYTKNRKITTKPYVQCIMCFIGFNIFSLINCVRNWYVHRGAAFWTALQHSHSFD